MKLKHVLPVLFLVAAMLACSLPGGSATPAVYDQALLQTAVSGTQTALPTETQAVMVEESLDPTAEVLPPSTPTSQALGCLNPHFKTYHVFVQDGGPGFGEWDSNLALSRWTDIGIALAWATGKPFANCQVDFIYDEPTANPFIVVHPGEATQEEVTELVTLVNASELIWVYKTQENTDVMSRTPAPADANVTFLRFQVYKNPIVIPDLLKASWE